MIVRELKKLFEGFDIHIILFYREYLSRIFSDYVFMANYPVFSVGFMPHFYTHLMKELSTESGTTSQNVPFVIEQFGDVFPILASERNSNYNISIIDLYGAIYSGKSQLTIVLCEIVNIPCNRINNFYDLVQDKGKMIENLGSKDTLSRQFMDLLSSQLAMRGFFIPEWHLDSVIGLTRSILQEHRKFKEIPTTVTSFRNISEVALKYDESVRKKYEHLFLYSNSTANSLHLSNEPLQYEELDLSRLLLDSYWIDVLRKLCKAVEERKLLSTFM